MDLSFLKSVLPTIASALGGPFAGLAAGFIADKLNLSGKTVEDVTSLISGATPADMIAMKQIDADLQKYFASLGLKADELENADRDSARKREMEVKDSMPALLASIVTLGFFGILGWLMIKGFPAENKDILIYLMGALSTAWTGIIAYYFGSSKSSATKDKTISAALSTSQSTSP
jgi:hypothetical protein